MPSESQPSPALLFLWSLGFSQPFCFSGSQSDDCFIGGQTQITWLETFLSRLAFSGLSTSVPWRSSRSIISRAWPMGWLTGWLFSVYFWKGTLKTPMRLSWPDFNNLFLCCWIFSGASRLNWLWCVWYAYSDGWQRKKFQNKVSWYKNRFFQMIFPHLVFWWLLWRSKISHNRSVGLASCNC